jgi:hypothetical protein
MRTFTDYGPRRSGRTTRLTDEAVQEFFKNGWCFVSDHVPTAIASKMLCNRVCRRLSQEHRVDLIRKEVTSGVWIIANNPAKMAQGTLNWKERK